MTNLNVDPAQNDQRSLAARALLCGGIALATAELIACGGGHDAGYTIANRSSSEAPTTAPGECNIDQSVIFYADQAPEHSNFFGPEGNKTSAEAAFGDMFDRMCDDSALTVGEGEYTKRISIDTNNAEAAVNARDQIMVDYMQNTDHWGQGFQVLHEYLSKGNMSLETLSGSYHTLYMIANQRDGRPEIRQSQEDMTDKVVLKIDVTEADGTVSTFRFKIDCGFQPVQLEEFPGVPQLPPNLPPSHETPPPSITTPAGPKQNAHTPAGPVDSQPVEPPKPGPSVPASSTTAPPQTVPPETAPPDSSTTVPPTVTQPKP